MSTTAEPKSKRDKALTTAKVLGSLVTLLMALPLSIVLLLGMSNGEDTSQVVISLVVAAIAVLSAGASLLAGFLTKTPGKAKKTANFAIVPIVFAAIIFAYGLFMFGDASSNADCNQLGCLLALSFGPMIMGYGVVVALLAGGQHSALKRYSNSDQTGETGTSVVTASGGQVALPEGSQD